MPGIYSVFIINKSGGLIFNKVVCRLHLCRDLRMHVRARQ